MSDSLAKIPSDRGCFAFTLLVGLAIAAPAIAADAPIDFSRDVRPILSGNCFACHGFDEQSREADLRLDNREGATADLGGYAAVVPNDPDESELIARVTTDDPDTLMPPPRSHKKPLKPADVAVLRRWIEQGAPWGKHWSFESPVAAKLPDSITTESASHAIDYFVRQRLEVAGLKPAPPAPVYTLARRLAFDLTGLPPTAAEVATLGDNPTPQQWDAWIDRLLDSPHFGERMAMWWLDGARYSDTDGFQQDATRTNWPWRDWVIQAFNENMPFDQFTIQQFAGDLLPGARDEQKLATCFHRNHMHNGEGGRDPAESRVDYVLDRTNTFGTLWLGLTLGCTQCHDHKFDPISQRDYYSLTAFFNSIDEDGNAGGGAKPFLKYKSPLAQRAVNEATQLAQQTAAKLETVKTAAKADFDAAFKEMIARASGSVDGPFQPWVIVEPASLSSTEGTRLNLEADGVIRSNDSGQVQDDFRATAGPTPLERITGVRLEVFTDPSHFESKYSFAESGEFVLTNMKLRVRTDDASEIRDIELVRATASVDGEGLDNKYGPAVGTLDDDPRTGWTTRTKPVESVQTIVFELAEPLVLAVGEKLDLVLMQRSLAPRELIGRFRLSLTDQRGSAVRSLKPMPMEQLASAIATKAAQTPEVFDERDLSDSLRNALLDQFLHDYQPWQEASARNDLAKKQRSEAENAAGELNVTVLEERSEPRSTHVFVRGEWDQQGDEVHRAVLPAVLALDQVPTRLELAQWVVARDNPLTARVITNQTWQLFFGAGLVRTPNDFGIQGESPTHPELLDWLAVDFMESGWDIKHLIRQIVTSETYRQDSSVTAELLALDPENRLLARGSRFRLPSWMIRDAFLSYSGLLNPAIGGPPVFPYQPPGVWEDQFMGRFSYTPTIGPAQYRRTVYAFWRRSSAPTFLFDSAMRRTCEITPRQTNTPLQALTLMNDLTSLEASRTLADRMALTSADQVDRVFEHVLCRPPTLAEYRVLVREYATSLSYYEQHPDEAIQLTTVGQLESPPQDQAASIASSMLLASMIFNLDESITHE